MDRKRGAILMMILIIASIASFYFDSQIIKSVFLAKTGFLDEFFLGITFLSSEIIIFFVLTSLFLWNENKRKWILSLWATLLFSAIVSLALKIAVHRERPFQQGIVPLISALQQSSYALWNFSFPSFQAMLAFCAIPIISKEFPRIKYVWIIFAALVAFSRVYFGLHFPSDVVAGAIVGYMIGIAVVKYEEDSKIGEKIYRKILGR